MDKILIAYSPLADFSTAPWGILRVIDGKVTLDATKAFNRARRMLNAGANMFRILRQGVWEVARLYDQDDADYWDTLREYLAILHQPYQDQGLGKGATVIIDPFDGGSDKWIYRDHKKARKLLDSMFDKLGDLPYVEFTCGNEMNQAGTYELHEKVIYPAFKDAGRMPFAYGPGSNSTNKLLEQVKGLADRVWQTETTKIVYRAVHGVKDKDSESLLWAYHNWAEKAHPIRVIWSVDGAFKGASDCDWTTVNGKIQRRPSEEQWHSAIRFILDHAKTLSLSGGAVKYGFEYLPKAVNKDTCSARGVLTISEEYIRKWGKWPENYDKYPDDYVEPHPPTPSTPPIPPTPPVPPQPPPVKPCSYFFRRFNVWHWLRCILLGKH